MALAIVEARYTRPDELHPRCPLSFKLLQHSSKAYTFHFCHIVPKCFEKTICVKLSNNANNIFPSTELIHKNMELYQNIPNLTVMFERRFNEHYDQYKIIFSPEVHLLNELRAFIGANDSQPRLVLFAKGSRPFLDLHHRAFQEHHKSVAPVMSRFDELVSEQLFSQIMLHSPTMKSNKKQVNSQKKIASGFQVAVSVDGLNFPQMGVSAQAAKNLVGTVFQISSAFFENWEVAEHMMPAWILCHHSNRRTFEIGFRPECGSLIGAKEFKQGFHDDPTREIWSVSEASLLEYGMPSHLKEIQKKPIIGDLPKAKQLVNGRKLPNKPRQSKASKETTHKEEIDKVTLHSADENIGTSIAVYWTKGSGGSWREGTILAKDGDKVSVGYSDDRTELWHNLANIKYKIIDRLQTAPSQTDANSSFKWKCIGCECLNESDSAPTARSTCKECKREYRFVGVGKKRRST